MSRIAKKPVSVPQGVQVDVRNGRVFVKGPKGSLDLEIRPGVEVKTEAGGVRIDRVSDAREHRAFQGLMWSLVNNMVTGVSKGFEKRLDILGVGYSARLDGRTLILNVGFSHPVQIELPEGIELEIPKRTNKMIITGADRQAVGQFAADVRRVRPPEPYKGKGIRYEDEFVRRKAGKSAVGGGA
jgi:large subunit ribosomal protein L6